MNIQRLRYGWARGARIQRDYVRMGYMGKDFKPSARDDGWRFSDFPPSALFYHPFLWRIHPDDAHLEYGPISSALRDFALYGDTKYNPYAIMGMEWLKEYAYQFIDPRMSYHPDTWQMFRLFAAEFLADEGL